MLHWEERHQFHGSRGSPLFILYVRLLTGLNKLAQQPLRPRLWRHAPLLALTESWGSGLRSRSRLAKRLLPSRPEATCSGGLAFSPQRWSLVLSTLASPTYWTCGSLGLGSAPHPAPSLAQMHRPEQHEAAGGAVAMCPHGALCPACSCPRLEPGSRPGCLLPLGLLHQACHQVPCSPPDRWPSAPWPPPRLGQLPSPPYCSWLLPQVHPPKVPPLLELQMPPLP